MRARRLLRNSGLFDPDWYLEQLAHEQSGESRIDRDDALEHYLRAGAYRGLSPHPLFDPEHCIRQDPSAATSSLGAFVHFLQRGTRRGHTPHPFVDLDHYLKQAPEAGEHPFGMLGHYIEIGCGAGLTLNRWFRPHAYRARHPEVGDDLAAVVDFLSRAGSVIDTVPDRREFPRLYDDFDHVQADDFMARMRGRLRGRESPTVSVIMPVRDRSDTIGSAIESVLEQSYANFELLVIDDGSMDTTADVVAEYDDRRIQLISQEPSGVCRARNRGLGAASGTYVAYLDADNAWTPEFLESMAALLHTTTHRAAYSGLELVEDGRRRYRGAPLDRGALQEANYIDCNTLVHERELAARIGGWDESLRRANDWDFLLRLSEVEHLEYAPFIGVRYDHDRDRGDRISVREPFGFKFAVYAQHNLDWSEAESRESDPGLVSVVVPVQKVGRTLRPCLEALLATIDHETAEVLLVDNTPSKRDALRVFELADRLPSARVVRTPWLGLTPPLLMNYGLIASRGDVVAFVDPAVVVEPGWLEPLVSEVRAGKGVLAQGPVLQWDGSVANAGYLIGPERLPSPAFEGFASLAPEVSCSTDRQGLCWSLLAMNREEGLRVRGFDATFRGSLADVDLTLRLRRSTGLATRFVPGPGAALHPDAPPHDEVAAAEGQRLFAERWGDVVSCDEDERLSTHGLTTAWRQRTPSRWAAPDSCRPTVVWVSERQRPLRWAIKIGAFDMEARKRWGDWPFALSLRDALHRLGHEVVIDLEQGWYRPTSHLDDVVLVLRGKGRYRRDPGQVNLIWLISHPDLVTDDELARYDGRFVASQRCASKLERRLGRPTRTLLQCTDASRFVPGEESAEAEEVLFVGNSRGVTRPVVADALAAGLPLGVYGAHWGGRIPASNWRARHIPNQELPGHYRSAGVVLNDHWPDMRREGFLSNRLFDLAACGANVVSDGVEGMDALFGSVIRTYSGPQDLASVVGEALENRDVERERRLELSGRVRAEHSFDARARVLDSAAREQLAANERPAATSEHQF